MRFFVLLTGIIYFMDFAWALDWSQGLQEVSQNNAEILSAKNSLQSSLYLQQSAKSGYLPKISANAGTNYTNSSATAVTVATVKTNSVAVTATENLFAGFSDSAKIDQALYAKEGAEANLQSVIAKVSFDYKSSFMNLLFAQKYILLTNDIINRRQANLKLVQLRFESGRENIGSLHLSKAYLAQAKYDHLVASNALGIAQSQLAKVLGRENREGIDIVGVVPVTIPEESKLNFNDLTFSTPEYKKALSEERISLTTIESSKSNFYPALNLSQNISRSSRDSGPWGNYWGIGAELSFPLFSGGKDYYSYKSSTELYRSSVMNKKNIQDSGIVKLKDAYAKFNEAIAKLEVDQAFVEAGNSRERIAKEKYNNGLLTFDEWDIIENDLIGRQKSLVQSERDRVVAEASWEQVQGKGVLQ
jgi:outer membrane protein TolC